MPFFGPYFGPSGGSSSSNPALTTIDAVLYDGEGSPVGGADIHFILLSGPETTGQVFSARQITVTTEEDGSFIVELLRDSLYKAKVEDGNWKKFRTADASSTSIPEIVGYPSIP